jgi:hypothetical protein
MAQTNNILNNVSSNLKSPRRARLGGARAAATALAAVVVAAVFVAVPAGARATSMADSTLRLRGRALFVAPPAPASITGRVWNVGAVPRADGMSRCNWQTASGDILFHFNPRCGSATV